MQIIQNKQSVTLTSVLQGLGVDQTFIVEPFTEVYQHVLAYLLSWKLLLTSFRHSPAEVTMLGVTEEKGLSRKL